MFSSLSVSIIVATFCVIPSSMLQHYILPHPWGNCSTTPVNGYYDDEKYTRFKCIRKCESQSLEEICGCKDIYMDGNYLICRMNTTL